MIDIATRSLLAIFDVDVSVGYIVILAFVAGFSLVCLFLFLFLFFKIFNFLFIYIFFLKGLGNWSK